MSWVDWFSFHHRRRGGTRRRITELEDRMGTIEDQVNELTAQVTEYNQDVAAKLAALEAAIGDNPPAPILAALVTLKETVAAGVSFVGDADADGTPTPPPPPVEPPVEPTPF